MVYNYLMRKWIITGASGSVATACMNILVSNEFTVDAYSRSMLNVHNKNISSTMKGTKKGWGAFVTENPERIK